MDQATKRQHADRFINVFIAFAGTLAVCLFIQHYCFEDTTWMQPIMDEIQGLSGWTVTTIIAVAIAVAYILLVWFVGLYWIHHAQPMDDETSERWERFFRDLDARKGNHAPHH